jgi:hypothetical protein
MKQIERLLVLQGQRCFFCDSPIPEGEARVEHQTFRKIRMHMSLSRKNAEVTGFT